MKRDPRFKREQEKFRNSARVYQKEKEWMQEQEKLYPNIKNIQFEDDVFKVDLSEDTGKGEVELYQLYRKDVQYVDDILTKIDRMCGHNARILIWALYVDNRIQVDVAEEFGLTRRQLQYSVDKWLHEVLLDDDQK